MEVSILIREERKGRISEQCCHWASINRVDRYLWAGYTLIISHVWTRPCTISWDWEPITIHFSQYHRFRSSLILRETWQETCRIVLFDISWKILIVWWRTVKREMRKMIDEMVYEMPSINFSFLSFCPHFSISPSSVAIWPVLTGLMVPLSWLYTWCFSRFNMSVHYFVRLGANHYTLLTISPISFIFDSARNLTRNLLYHPLWRFVENTDRLVRTVKCEMRKMIGFMKCHLYISHFSRFANIFSCSRQFDDKCIAGFGVKI